jgi:transcriptional regulator
VTYIPDHFRESGEETLLEFMRTYDFATVVSASAAGLVTSHVPVLVRPSGASCVIVGHLARANDHWRLMDGTTPALVVFHGPHGYVSPTWYETAPAVPTWNYGVVHVHGFPKTNEDDGFVRDVLEELVSRYEGNRSGGWRPESLPSDFHDRMVGGIVAFEMTATKLEGKFKLGQNRSVEDRRRTIAALQNEGSQGQALAEFMRRRAGV